MGYWVANGDRFGGFALFIKTAALCSTSTISASTPLINSSEPLPTGLVALRYVFDRTGDFQGFRYVVRRRQTGRCREIFHDPDSHQPTGRG